MNMKYSADYLREQQNSKNKEREKSEKIKLDFSPPKLVMKQQIFAYDSELGKFISAKLLNIDFSNEVAEFTVKSGKKTFKTFKIRRDKKREFKNRK